MNKEESELLERVTALSWKIDFFRLLDCSDDQPKDEEPLYAEGDIFRLASRDGSMIDRLVLTKCEGQRDLELPFFMCISPTWFVRDGVLHVVFICGKSPCELHRFAIWFECLDTDKPIFGFKVEPVYKDCHCEDDCGPDVLYARHPGIGGGTGN